MLRILHPLRNVHELQLSQKLIAIIVPKLNAVHDLEKNVFVDGFLCTKICCNAACYFAVESFRLRRGHTIAVNPATFWNWERSFGWVVSATARHRIVFRSLLACLWTLEITALSFLPAHEVATRLAGLCNSLPRWSSHDTDQQTPTPAKHEQKINETLLALETPR